MSSRRPPDLPVDRLGSRGRFVAVVAAAVAVVALGWFVRPWLHAPIYALYTTPELFVALATTLVVVAVVGAATGRVGWVLAAAPPLALVLIVGLVVVGGLYGSSQLGTGTMAAASDRATLPEIDADHPRILPRATADRYAANSLQTSQFYAVGGDITVLDGTAYWSYALAPDGFRNRLVERQSGTVLVDMERQEKAVRIVEGEMRYGQGMSITDSYRWQLYKHGPYLVDYQDPFMVVHEGEQYMAVPYTRPRFHARALPVPNAFTTPEWGGVALIASDGEIQHLSPAAAREHPVLADPRLMPVGLVRQRVAATAYRNGILNVMPVIGAHDEQIEVAPVPGEGNDQPFYTRTREGAKYVVAVEPYGNKQGVREVWVVDARTESYEVFRTDSGSTLLGPRKAADFVRQAARETDWDRFTPSEPIPAVVDGTLYWQLRVVPNDASGISYVAFVNAASSGVTGVETTREVRAFLRGEYEGGGGDSGDDRPPAVVVEKRNADGEVVDTMVVYGNETVVVRPGNVTSAPTATG